MLGIIYILGVLGLIIFTSLPDIKNPGKKIVPIISLAIMCLTIYISPIALSLSIFKLFVTNTFLLHFFAILEIIPCIFWYTYLRKQYIHVLNT